MVANLLTKFCSLMKLAEALGPLPVGELVFVIADLPIMAGQLQEVMVVIHIFITEFCETYFTLTQLNGLFSIWDGAYLYEMRTQKVKGATNSLEDDFYDLSFLEYDFATQSIANVTTMVTVPFVRMSYYHHISTSFLN
ncbi:hypothetical protein RND71_010775 [Anisodus tanguticus]|uniref:Uncharacterized protein n=1 Tax=Anisodus tanguticus TaxID=243964 RepID=A0AAE1SKE4_9SOLA|nr:hypothetical protein RND71_010775 [Anisodus tanguticus]